MIIITSVLEVIVVTIVHPFLIHAAPFSTVGTQINFQGSLAVLSFTASQNLTLSITGKTHPGVDDTILSTWYCNGNSLPPGSKLEPLKRPLLNVSQSLTLENSSILDAGTYEVLLAIDPYTHLISHLGCHYNYYSFVDSTVRADDAVLAQTKLELKYYGMLCVINHTGTINSHKKLTQPSSLCCRALNVYCAVTRCESEHHGSLFCHWGLPSHHKHLSPEEWECYRLHC